MARATSSFPVPLSPVSRTVVSCPETRAAWSKTSRMAPERPMMLSNPYRSASASRRRSTRRSSQRLCCSARGHSLLFLGQALVLERDHHLSRDPGDHLGVTLVEPVGVVFGKREHSAERISKDERGDDHRPHAAFERRPIAWKGLVELATGVAE